VLGKLKKLHWTFSSLIDRQERLARAMFCILFLCFYVPAEFFEGCGVFCVNRKDLFCKYFFDYALYAFLIQAIGRVKLVESHIEMVQLVVQDLIYDVFFAERLARYSQGTGKSARKKRLSIRVQQQMIQSYAIE
jgi:hypothetical protein